MKTTTYYRDGNPRLHYSIRTYFDSFSTEFEDRTLEQKLLDLAVAFDAGIDLQPDIDDMLKNHPDMAERSIRRTILNYIEYLRTGNDGCYTKTVFVKEDISYKIFLDLLKKELAIRFSPGIVYDNLNTWSFDRCIKTIHWNYEKLFNEIHDHETAVQILLQPTKVHSDCLLLLLGTGAYNIFNTNKDRVRFRFEVAGTGVRCINREITRMLGDDDPDTSFVYPQAYWESIFMEYEKYGVEDVTVLTCMNGYTAKNLENALRAARKLDFHTSVVCVLPFLFEGDVKLKQAEKRIYLLDEMVTGTISVYDNQQILRDLGEMPFEKAMDEFNKKICKELLFGKRN